MEFHHSNGVATSVISENVGLNSVTHYWVNIKSIMENMFDIPLLPPLNVLPFPDEWTTVI